jgi:hypothetical protein
MMKRIHFGVIAFFALSSLGLGQVITTNRNPVGLEHNLLFNATTRYTVTQTGSASLTLTSLFDGRFEPSYTDNGVVASSPTVVTIEGLPNYHTQAGAIVGWSTRYWPADHFKVEAYNVYASASQWVTVADYTSTVYSGCDFNTWLPGGSYTKLRFTFFSGTGDNGQLGVSELFFLHPEATSPYAGLFTTASSISSNGNGDVGIGTSNPTEKLQIAGNVSMLIDGCAFDIEKSVRTYPWNFSSRPAGWYRIGTNVGNRANATFELRDEADHSTLKFVVGCSYNALGGASVTVLSHNVYSGAVFKKIRLLTKTTYDAQYLEVYIDPHNNDNLAFFAIVRDNLQDSGWNLNNYDSGSVPAGYTSTEYNVDDLFLVAGVGDEKSFRVARNGNVGIGTTAPTEKLSVNGKIRAKEVIVDTGWSDYVFADDYKLTSLADVEAQIKTNKHLPGVPSAQEVAEKGVSVGNMQAILLAKIEELTLHQIAQEKRTLEQEKQLSDLKAQNTALQARVEQLSH